MGLLREIVDRYKEKKAKQKQYEEDLAIQRIVAEKQKSANERELDSYIKEQRESQIKAQIEKVKKRKTNDFWRTNVFAGKNIFSNNGGNLLGWR